jgi:hypothetical protein
VDSLEDRLLGPLSSKTGKFLTIVWLHILLIRLIRTLGWRWVEWILAIITFGSAVVMLLLVPETQYTGDTPAETPPRSWKDDLRFWPVSGGGTPKERRYDDNAHNQNDFFQLMRSQCCSRALDHPTILRPSDRHPEHCILLSDPAGNYLHLGEPCLPLVQYHV